MTRVTAKYDGTFSKGMHSSINLDTNQFLASDILEKVRYLVVGLRSHMHSTGTIKRILSRHCSRSDGAVSPPGVKTVHLNIRSVRVPTNGTRRSRNRWA